MRSTKLQPSEIRCQPGRLNIFTELRSGVSCVQGTACVAVNTHTHTHTQRQREREREKK